MTTTCLLIGDSITGDYAPLVRAELSTVEVIGPTENVATSRNLLRLVADLAGRSYSVVHVNCGLHDIKRYRGIERPDVPVDEYGRNVARALDLLRACTPRLVWARTTPIAAATSQPDHTRVGTDIAVYNAAADAAVAGRDVVVDDLHRVVVEAGTDRCLLPDGVHMTDYGNRILAHAVAASLTMPRPS